MKTEWGESCVFSTAAAAVAVWFLTDSAHKNCLFVVFEFCFVSFAWQVKQPVFRRRQGRFRSVLFHFFPWVPTTVVSFYLITYCCVAHSCSSFFTFHSYLQLVSFLLPLHRGRLAASYASFGLIPHLRFGYPHFAHLSVSIVYIYNISWLMSMCGLFSLRDLAAWSSRCIPVLYQFLKPGWDINVERGFRRQSLLDGYWIVEACHVFIAYTKQALYILT